uniref:EFHB C-terminal EF-hand domain-containing protein n=1 Tax=Glossina pallidipes TaxID=7398 RepID=A0A1B0ABF8_GLOPL
MSPKYCLAEDYRERIMAYKGKYIDRHPDIRAAGKIFATDERLGDRLNMYSDEEMASYAVRYKCKEKAPKHELYPASPFLPVGTMHEIVSPDLKRSRFVSFREKVLEEMYFPKHKLGKPFVVHSKPDTLTNENMTYGMPVQRSESVKDLLFPSKTAGQVNRDYIEWHDKYLLSHKHYFPSEQINRHYNGKFDKNSTFGILFDVDKTGKMVKKILQKNKCGMETINLVQKKFVERTSPVLAKGIDRFELHLDRNETRGKPCVPDECNARHLTEPLNPCQTDTNLNKALAHVYKLRLNLFKRENFHMQDLIVLLRKHDERGTGYVTMESVWEVMYNLQIHVNVNKLRLAALSFDVVTDQGLPTERLHINKFWKMLDVRYPLPHIESVMPFHDNKDTTYRLLCEDYKKPLGSLFISYQSRLNDEDRTRVSDLVCPGIPLQFGLCPSDFEIPRSKEQLRAIFKNLLGQNFDKIWELTRATLKGDENCEISRFPQCLSSNPCDSTGKPCLVGVTCMHAINGDINETLKPRLFNRLLGRL